MIRLKRLWYRLNTRAVWPEHVQEGDSLLFDFPGTGPYWTAPVWRRGLTWGKLHPFDDEPRQMHSYLVFDNGGTLFVDLKTPIRVRR